MPTRILFLVSGKYLEHMALLIITALCHTYQILACLLIIKYNQIYYGQ